MNPSKVKVEFRSGGPHSLSLDYALVEVSFTNTHGIPFPTEASILKLEHGNDVLTEQEIEKEVLELAKASALKRYLTYDPKKMCSN